MFLAGIQGICKLDPADRMPGLVNNYLSFNIPKRDKQLQTALLKITPARLH
jgi:hypothetical protein